MNRKRTRGSNMWLTALLSTLAITNIADAASCTYSDVQRHNLVCQPSTGDSKLNKVTLPNNIDIKSVTLKACRITEVVCDTFTVIPSVQHIDLAQNKIKELPTCVFDGLAQLMSLNLSYNQVVELPLEIFNAKDNLETIDLKGNKIQLLPRGIFDNMPKLRKLDLSSNEILGQHLKSASFGNNQQINYLDLSRNSLADAPDDLLNEFQNLQYLYLDRCFLTEVPVFATGVNLKTLKQLVLSTNQITSLDDATIFKNLDNLEILNLAGNAIESVAENVFAPMRKLKGVVLKKNKLKVIPEKLFQNMPKLVIIDVSYNDIKTVEVNMFRNTPAKNLNVSGNKLTYLPQNFYREMINSGGKLKKFLFSNNPWQCACLIEILQDMKTNNIEYNNEHFNGRKGVCVSSNDFTCKRE